MKAHCAAAGKPFAPGLRSPRSGLVQLDLQPDGLLHGKDLQLDYAIDYLQQQIAKAPRDLSPAPPVPPRPLQPVR